jgi:hypothetical protein
MKLKVKEKKVRKSTITNQKERTNVEGNQVLKFKKKEQRSI